MIAMKARRSKRDSRAALAMTIMAGFICAMAMPSFSQEASVPLTGVDDLTPNIPASTQALLDATVMHYYEAPSTEKVNQVLDTINDSEVLRKKTAWAPFIGFLTVIFQDNPKELMGWMSRNDYNSYAEDVIVAALLHAGHKEEAMMFARAHQWKKNEMEHIALESDHVDLKHLSIVLPGHVDTLWGAFFASGDPVYIEQLVLVLFTDKLPAPGKNQVPYGKDVLGENKTLAKTTLKRYAPYHPRVRGVIEAHLQQERDPARVAMLKGLLPAGMPRK